MAPRDRADSGSAASVQVAAALGLDELPVVRPFAHSSRTGALVCEVHHEGSRLFAKVYPDGDVVSMSPRLLLSDQLRSPEPARLAARELVDREWKALTELGSLDGDAAVPRPVARSETVLLCTWVDGISLQQLVMRTRRPLGRRGGPITSFRRAGRWLRRMHTSVKAQDGHLDLHHEGVAVGLLADEAPRTAKPHLLLARELLAEAGQRLGRARVSTPITVTHGDFSLPNLLVTASGVVLVDFEHYGRRLALHDLVAIVANLRAKLVDPRYRRDDVAAWEHAFWDGYVPSATDRLLTSVLSTTWLLCRFAPHKFRLRWARLALGIAEWAGRGFREDLLRAVTWREVPDVVSGDHRKARGRW